MVLTVTVYKISTLKFDVTNHFSPNACFFSLEFNAMLGKIHPVAQQVYIKNLPVSTSSRIHIEAFQ
jgi:hypothetical protein